MFDAGRAVMLDVENGGHYHFKDGFKSATGCGDSARTNPSLVDLGSWIAFMSMVHVCHQSFPRIAVNLGLFSRN